MCLVEVEKMPKLMAACTLPVAEGMVVRTETPQVAAARKYTLEFLLTNHPLDCPVCDKGGECELQDMVFRYGAGESRFTEEKVHMAEKQWSPVVFFDAPRCILCFRCVRICNEGMGVGALGIVNRGVVSEIAPNHGDHLECDECGTCIDICPVGALTSGTYRYQTRPWEMSHVGTICTHCADGCKTTLGRAQRRDHPRQQSRPLRHQRRVPVHQGPLRASISTTIRTGCSRRCCAMNGKLGAGLLVGGAGRGGREVQRGAGRAAAGSASSAPTTPPTKRITTCRSSPREVLGTANIDHHRTGDVVDAAGRAERQNRPAGRPPPICTTARPCWCIGADLALEHPLLSFQMRANYRHHQAHVYVVTPGAGARRQIRGGQRARGRGRRYFAALESLRDKLQGRARTGDSVRRFLQGRRRPQAGGVRRVAGHPGEVHLPGGLFEFARRASDMGLHPRRSGGHVAARDARAPTWTCCGWWARIRCKRGTRAARPGFWWCRTCSSPRPRSAPTSCCPPPRAYEKNGTVTNVCGEVQRLKRAVQDHGRQAGSGDHRASSRAKWAPRPHWAPGCRTRCSKRSAGTCAATTSRSRDRHRRRRADDAGQRARRRRRPARAGAVRRTTACSPPAPSGAILRY